jgi:hypothetical protein
MADDVLLWERVILPVPAGPDSTILVCYSEVMSHQLEVYEYVFRNSPVPMMVIYPIFTPQKVIDDGWIVLVNETGRVMFDLREPVGNRRLRELKAFQSPELWEELAHSFSAPNPESSLQAPVLGERYLTLLVRLKHLALFRFPPRMLQQPTLV